MTKYFFTLTSILILSFTSCKKDKTTNPDCTDGSANFTHLGVGHELRYVFYSFSLAEDSMIVKNISVPTAGTYKSTITFLPSNNPTDIYYHACGMDLYTSLDGNFNQYGHFWLSLSANVGESWSRSLNGRTYTYKLYSKDATVTTPSLNKTFTNCYKFTYQSNTSFFGADTIYFKPEIGIVYYEGFDASYELASKNF